MSGSYEQTIIVGNVGNSDELRYTQSDTAVHSFSVAVTTRWRDNSTNEQREKTQWYKVSCWRGLAEITAKYVTKGMSVMVVGTASTSAYLDKDGNPQASLEVTAKDVQFLTRADGGNGSGESGSSYDPASGKIVDDVPF